MSQRIQWIYLGSVLIGAAFVLLYRGPQWPFVRSYMGDWLIVQFLYLIGRFWIPHRRRYHWVAGVMLIALLTEVFQYLSAGSFSRTLATDLTIGSTFDALDIAAYVLGLVTVLVIDRNSA